MRTIRIMCIVVVSTVLQNHLTQAADQSAGTSANPASTSPPTINYEAHIFANETPPEGGKLANPFAGDKSAAARGGQLFSSMNCDGCHGGDASGFAAPSLSDGRWRYGGAEDELFQTIYFGRPKGMPAFGGLMSSDDIWSIVTYIKSLPAPEDAPTESWVGR